MLGEMRSSSKGAPLELTAPLALRPGVVMSACLLLAQSEGGMLPSMALRRFGAR